MTGGSGHELGFALTGFHSNELLPLRFTAATFALAGVRRGVGTLLRIHSFMGL